jgi:23S rRNA pseudouridine2605 synthase
MSTRLNRYIATSSTLSRRAADQAIADGRVLVNGKEPSAGQGVEDTDTVTLDGRELKPLNDKITIMLNKPVGYVVSRDGQGSPTIYDLLSYEYQQLNPVGRLDKNSSGLLLLTNDGELAHKLTHPSFEKTKVYEVALHLPLKPLHRQMISDHGLQLEDGLSKLQLERMVEGDDKQWRIRMHEGRNRQIRRTFNSLGYEVMKLHRTNFGDYTLGNLDEGQVKVIA